ncbi:MAG: hypothetical protein JEZ14_19505 [Marinilabiliaceae bacterium]|nr:hypothetical protein [Marinilabiliaceae bacterium]
MKDTRTTEGRPFATGAGLPPTGDELSYEVWLFRCDTNFIKAVPGCISGVHIQLIYFGVKPRIISLYIDVIQLGRNAFVGKKQLNAIWCGLF